MKKFGEWSELTQIVLRTSGDNKEVTVLPPSTLTGANNALTTPEITGTSDTLISRVSTDQSGGRLQNKHLAADNVGFVDDTDTTKRLFFDLSGFASSSTQTVVFPDASDTVALLAEAQTLTNKTIDGDDNTVQDLALSSLKTSGNTGVFLQRDGSGDVIDSTKAVPSGDVVGTSDSQTLTNKSIDSDNNTITNIVNADIKAAAAIAVNKLAAVTASRALASDGSGFITASSVTDTELGYVSGVTSAIQTQIDGKQAEVMTTRGDIVYRDSGNATARLGIGTAGQVLTSDGTDVAWDNPAGTGDVTAAAVMTDNALIRGDGGAKGIQDSGILIDDSDNMTGVESLTTQQVALLKATANDMTLASGETTFHPLLTVSTGDTYTVDSGADFYSIDTVIVDGTFTVNGNATVLH